MLKYYVDFAGKQSWQLLNESPLASGNHVTIKQPEQIIDLFDMLIVEGLELQSGYQAICASLLNILILKIGQLLIVTEESKPAGYMTFIDIKRDIDERFLSLWKIEELAIKFQTSSAQICRLFQTFAQTTPFKYLIRLKMQEAAALLLDEHLLVKEVAVRLGYSDPFHFSRVFKRVYGISPETFVRNIQH
jgi:AraC-like DNA-binding protein